MYVLELQYEHLKDVLAQFSCSYPFQVVVVSRSTEVLQQMLVLCCERRETNAMHITCPIFTSGNRTLSDGHSKGVGSRWEVPYHGWLYTILPGSLQALFFSEVLRGSPSQPLARACCSPRRLLSSSPPRSDRALEALPPSDLGLGIRSPC